MLSLPLYILSNPFAIALLLSVTHLETAFPGAPDHWRIYFAGLKVLQPVVYIVICANLLYALNRWVSKKSINNFVDDLTWDWPNEIAVVTGGSSGIGAEVVRALAREKIKTIILDVNRPSSELEDGATFYQVNLTSSSAISGVAATIKQEHGNPSILINNAGTGTAHTILSESESERRRVFEVNTLCHFTLVREFLPAMIKKDHGHIVTIASTGSFYSQAQNVSYACSKSAAMAFHEGLGQELRIRFNARRVRTSIIFPDFVRTPLVHALTSKVAKFPVQILEPSEIAKVVVEAILSTYGHRIILPKKMAYLALLRGLPPWIQRYVQAKDPDVLALVNK